MTNNEIKTLWMWADAVELALDMYHAGEIKFDEMDKVATELWNEMQVENENPA